MMKAKKKFPSGPITGGERSTMMSLDELGALQARLRSDSNRIDELRRVMSGCERVLERLGEATSVEVTINGDGCDKWHGFEQARLMSVSGKGKPDIERALRACREEARRELEALEERYR